MRAATLPCLWSLLLAAPAFAGTPPTPAAVSPGSTASPGPAASPNPTVSPAPGAATVPASAQAPLDTPWSRAPGAPTCVADGPLALAPEGDGLLLPDGHLFHDGRWTRPWAGGVSAALWDHEGLLVVAGDQVDRLTPGGKPKRLAKLRPEGPRIYDQPHRYSGPTRITRRGDRYAVLRADAVYLAPGRAPLRRVALNTRPAAVDAIQGYMEAALDLWTATPRLVLGWNWSAACGGGGEGHDLLAIGARLKDLPPAQRPATPEELESGPQTHRSAYPSAFIVLGASQGWSYLQPIESESGPEGGSEFIVAVQPGEPPVEVLRTKAVEDSYGAHGVVAPSQESVLVAQGGALWRLQGAEPAVRFGPIGATEQVVAFDGQRALVRTATHLERRDAQGQAAPVLPLCSPRE